MDPQTAVKDKNFSPGRDPSVRDRNSSMGRGFFIQEVNVMAEGQGRGLVKAEDNGDENLGLR